MPKKFLVSESERQEIRKLYSLHEQSFIEKVVGAAFDILGNKEKSTDDNQGTKDSIIKTNTEKDNISVENGVVKATGNFDNEQQKNISLLIDKMNESGIKDPYAQIGILSVINKECNFKPKGEVSYSNTSNERIRKLFGKRVSKFSDSELNKLKKNDKEFFNVIYAKTVGNQGGDDGWNYRGRGFNQLTGIKNYEKYGNMIGMGDKLVENPELVNDPEIAAKIAIAFLTKNKPISSIPKFESKEEAAGYFADVNSGGGSSSHRDHAIDKSSNFDVQVA